MKLTFFTSSGESFFLELPSDMSVQDVKLLLEGDSNVPVSDQIWTVDGKEVVESDKTLEQLGWPEEVVVSFSRKQSQQHQQQQQQHQNSQASGSSNPQYTPAQLEQLRQMMARQSEEHELMDRLEADPYDVESQTKIAEFIRLKAVNQSYEDAMEHSPESFAQVTMLYIDVEVNGHKVKAFVDSGAQSTIMSPDCAEQCNLMRLLDTRFHGEARGVGTAKILGRIHSAQIKLADLHLPVSFTVMEGKDVDLLFGLDMLKRHLACIDLSKGGGVLRIQGREVPFLSEHELPAKAKRETWVDDEDDPRGGKKPKTAPANPDVPGGVSAEEAAKEAAKGVVNFPGGGNTLSSNPAQPQPSASTSSSSASAPSATAVPASKYPEQSIQTLVDLGVTREQAVGYLDMCNGDVDQAASLLF